MNEAQVKKKGIKQLLLSVFLIN